LEKLHFVHSANPLYGKPRMSTPEFIIKHYAGEVIYEVRNFLDKNRDLLRTDVIDMFINSRNSVRIYLVFLKSNLVLILI
jgi:myosin heavy subunit